MLRHAYFSDFTRGDATRTAYADRSCAAAAPYEPPLDDDTRLSTAAYRRFMEASLATALEEPVSAPAPTAASGLPAGLADEDDMGA